MAPTGDVIVLNELLAYVKHYRDCTTMDKLREVVVGFHSIGEIADTKKKLITMFDTALPLDCPFRRSVGNPLCAKHTMQKLKILLEFSSTR
jgi:hypothetical protein